MTSPAPSIDEPFEDEGDLLGDEPQNDIIEEDDGEELFGDNMEASVLSLDKFSFFNLFTKIR